MQQTQAPSALEVGDIFRRHGAEWRQANKGHVSLGQLKVMTAIERCRTAALGGHVLACERCHQTHIAYNSCRNRHCPKCQAAASQKWLDARAAELLPVPYYHVVFTLPQELRDLAFQNKRVIYNLLFQASAETVLKIAADPKHLGAKIGFTSVLHTWGSAMTHHPHIHMIVPGGGLSPDGKRWQACRPNFFLPVKVLSRLFRRLFCQQLKSLHQSGKLHFFGASQTLAELENFTNWLGPLEKSEWVVYAKAPFAGPQAVLTYLSRYTHRVAIANSRLVALKDGWVTFRYKDYRANKSQNPGPAKRWNNMILPAPEFIRRFLLHVLPKSLHRIRHFGFLASQHKAENLAKIRSLLEVLDASSQETKRMEKTATEPFQPCVKCGGRMLVTGLLRPTHPGNCRSPPASKRPEGNG